MNRAHTWQVSCSTKDLLPSHCTKSEATDKAARELQPEPEDYLGWCKRAGKNCCSRELESASTALNRKLSMLCTPPRTRISKQNITSCTVLNKNIPKHGWVITAMSFNPGQEGNERGKF